LVGVAVSVEHAPGAAQTPRESGTCSSVWRVTDKLARAWNTLILDGGTRAPPTIASIGHMED